MRLVNRSYTQVKVEVSEGLGGGSRQAVPTSGSVKVTKLTQAFCDYLPHVQHMSQDDWDVIIRVCTDYDQGHTHYSLRDAKRWKAYCAKATDDPITKKPS